MNCKIFQEYVKKIKFSTGIKLVEAIKIIEKYIKAEKIEIERGRL